MDFSTIAKSAAEASARPTSESCTEVSAEEIPDAMKSLSPMDQALETPEEADELVQATQVTRTFLTTTGTWLAINASDASIPPTSGTNHFSALPSELLQEVVKLALVNRDDSEEWERWVIWIDCSTQTAFVGFSDVHGPFSKNLCSLANTSQTVRQALLCVVPRRKISLFFHDPRPAIRAISDDQYHLRHVPLQLAEALLNQAEHIRWPQLEYSVYFDQPMPAGRYLSFNSATTTKLLDLKMSKCNGSWEADWVNDHVMVGRVKGDPFDKHVLGCRSESPHWVEDMVEDALNATTINIHSLRTIERILFGRTITSTDWAEHLLDTSIELRSPAPPPSAHLELWVCSPFWEGPSRMLQFGVTSLPTNPTSTLRVLAQIKRQSDPPRRTTRAFRLAVQAKMAGNVALHLAQTLASGERRLLPLTETTAYMPIAHTRGLPGGSTVEDAKLLKAIQQKATMLDQESAGGGRASIAVSNEVAKSYWALIWGRIKASGLIPSFLLNMV